MASNFVGGVFQAQNASGALPGALLYTYAAGTRTPLATFTSQSGLSSNANPVVCDSNGQAHVWLGTNSYYMELKTAAGVMVWPEDHISAPLSTADLLLSTGTSLIGHAAPYATAYLKNLSDILNGERFDMLMGVPVAQRAAIQAYTSTYDCAADISSVLTDMNTAKRGDLYFSDGLYNVGSVITTLGLEQRISGAGRRGFGSGASNYRGTVIKATGTNGVFAVNPGAVAASDILIQHICFLGSSGGVNDGLSFTNVSGVTIEDCVVAFFRRNITMPIGLGSSYLICKDVYSSNASESNFYIDAQYCRLESCSSDNAPYSVNVTTNGMDLSIYGRSHFEGATTTAINILGNNAKLTDVLVNNTSAPSNGVFCSASGLGMVNCRIRGIGTNVLGLNVTGISYRLVGNHVTGWVTAAKIETGYGSIGDNVFEGVTTGLELVGGFGAATVIGNTISGATNTILHTSGSLKWNIGANRLDDGAGNFKAMSISSGQPNIMGQYEGPMPTVASTAALIIPAGCNGALIGGTTNITSLATTGFTNRTVTLIFAGALTFTDGSNLKLAGNFVTTADDTITLFCDGTNWYEVCRSVN